MIGDDIGQKIDMKEVSKYKESRLKHTNNYQDLYKIIGNDTGQGVG